jgi:hypothetical protein
VTAFGGNAGRGRLNRRVRRPASSPLARETVSNGVGEVILNSQNQALTLVNFARGGSLSLEPPQFRDVAPQACDQPVDRARVSHEPAS